MRGELLRGGSAAAAVDGGRATVAVGCLHDRGVCKPRTLPSVHRREQQRRRAGAFCEEACLAVLSSVGGLSAPHAVGASLLGLFPRAEVPCSKMHSV